VAQGVAQLPTKHEAMSSNSSAKKKKGKYINWFFFKMRFLLGKNVSKNVTQMLGISGSCL
jgi:hypothetical protein